MALGYSEPTKAVREHVEPEDRWGSEMDTHQSESQNATPYIKDSMGRIQYPTWINESGLYALVFGSKLESAKRFKHWVTSEVLPSIRKNGMYHTNQSQDIQTLANTMKQLSDSVIETQNNIKNLYQNQQNILNIMTMDGGSGRNGFINQKVKTNPFKPQRND